MKHKHHIIPKHMGGSNDPSNLIELTVEEHAEAHKKLYDEYGNWQDYLAWQGLSGRMGKEELIREKISNTHKGKKLTEEHIEVLKEKGKKLIGDKNPMFGKNISTEHKLAISKANTGKIISVETREKMSLASTGRKHTVESNKINSDKAKERWANGVYDVEKLRLSRIGFKQPESQKQAVSKALSKEWMIISPTGCKQVITNLRQFCRDNKLDQGNLSRGSYKGWKCKKVVI